MMSEKSNLKNVDKSFLETLSKSELVNLILKQMSQKKYPSPASKEPIPTPITQKSLEDSKPSQPPISEKRTIISQVEQALTGFTKSFDIELRDKKDPLIQLQKSRNAIEYLFNNQLKVSNMLKHYKSNLLSTQMTEK